jgi:hypothetical protein
MTDGQVTIDAITDAEYPALAIDMRHPVMVAPTRGAISPGVVTFKSSYYALRAPLPAALDDRGASTSGVSSRRRNT